MSWELSPAVGCGIGRSAPMPQHEDYILFMNKFPIQGYSGRPTSHYRDVAVASPVDTIIKDMMAPAFVSLERCCASLWEIVPDVSTTVNDCINGKVASLILL